MLIHYFNKTEQRLLAITRPTVSRVRLFKRTPCKSDGPLLYLHGDTRVRELAVTSLVPDNREHDRLRRRRESLDGLAGGIARSGGLL